MASYNLISLVSNGSFEGLHALEDISLRHNHIHHIESGAFLALEHLRTVNLVENYLRQIFSDIFSRNLYMTDVLLGTNLFHSIPYMNYSSHYNLSIIDFSRNQIKSSLFICCPVEPNIFSFLMHNNILSHMLTFRQSY